MSIVLFVLQLYCNIGLIIGWAFLYFIFSSNDFNIKDQYSILALFIIVMIIMLGWPYIIFSYRKHKNE